MIENKDNDLLLNEDILEYTFFQVISSLDELQRICNSKNINFDIFINKEKYQNLNFKIE